MSKSWLLTFVADAGQWFILLVCWVSAALLGLAARRLIKAGRRFSAMPLVLASIVLAVFPFMSRTAGRQYAEALCREIGGPHALTTLPVRTDGIHLQGQSDVNLFLLSSLLQQDSFEFIEHSPKGASGTMAYRIEPISSGRCTSDKIGGSDLARALIYFHEHGMRADECIAHVRQATSAAVTFGIETERRRQPIDVDIRFDRYWWSATGEPIWSYGSFSYFPVHPYSSKGSKLAFHCHQPRPTMQMSAGAGIVEGNGPVRSWPGLPIQPKLLASVETASVLAMRRTDVEVHDLSAELAYRLYREAMDLRTGGPQFWRPPHPQSGTTRVSWGEGGDATTVEVPEAARSHREYRTRLLAAKLADQHLFLVRLLEGTWELSDYDIARNEWRRIEVPLILHDQIAPIVWKFNSLHPWVTSIEILADRVLIKGLALRHEHGFPTLVDNGFELEFPRP